jgi:hypothetical protein
MVDSSKTSGGGAAASDITRTLTVDARAAMNYALVKVSALD